MRSQMWPVEETVSLPIPDTLQAKLSTFAGAEVEVELRDGQILLHRLRHRPTLDELLDKCDPVAPDSDEDIAWDRLPPVGRELL